MKIILQSQLSTLPSYLSPKEKFEYIDFLTSLGFTIGANNKDIVCELGGYPQVEVEHDSLDSFLEWSTQYFNVSYGGHRDENGTMIWTLLNDPYPC